MKPPMSAETLAPARDAEVVSTQERAYVAPPWRLMWWKFERHKVALASSVLLVAAYAAALFADFVAPSGSLTRSPHLYAPPQRVHLFHNGAFYGRPFVYGWQQRRDPQTLQLLYEPDVAKIYPIGFFVRGEPYKLWGLFESDLHLFGVARPGMVSLLGTDNLGRDMFGRVVHGARISLSIGLIGVFLSLIFGLILGGISGLYGGVFDTIVQRLIEVIIAIPAIPLWMGLSAAIPRGWTPLQTYLAVTIVLSVIGWTTVARIVRGKFISTREQDFVTAAKLYGTSEWRLITRHLIPTFISYVIVRVTLDIPRMILGETALSFLGIGLRPPIVSWGVLLQDAQKIQTVAIYPWLLSPALFVIAFVLAFSFLGDGLRDAADPYAGG